MNSKQIEIGTIYRHLTSSVGYAKAVKVLQPRTLENITTMVLVKCEWASSPTFDVFIYKHFKPRDLTRNVANLPAMQPDTLFAGGLGVRAMEHTEAMEAVEVALAQPEREPVAWNKPELGTLKHSDNCRYWDENISCTCGAIEYTGLQFWKNKVLVQPDRIPDAGKTIGAESTKREWVGLAQHQIAEVGFEMLPDVPQKDFLAFARYIEVLSKGAIK